MIGSQKSMLYRQKKVSRYRETLNIWFVQILFRTVRAWVWLIRAQYHTFCIVTAYSDRINDPCSVNSGNIEWYPYIFIGNHITFHFPDLNAIDCIETYLGFTAYRRIYSQREILLIRIRESC